jgi:hypothetical protein
MLPIPRIQAMITIVETNQIMKVVFTNVGNMMDELLIAIELASIALGRWIDPTPFNVLRGEDIFIWFLYEGTNEKYMTVLGHKLSD